MGGYTNDLRIAGWIQFALAAIIASRRN